MANSMMRFDPFGSLARFEPLRGFEDLFGDFRLRPGLLNMEPEPRIRVDVTESDDSYTVKADIPGVRKEDVKVSIDGSMVTIVAESHAEKEEKKGEKVVRSERYYGRQSRSFSLAHDIDETRASAKYNDGVLEMLLPKKAGGKDTRFIAVQ